jgi:YcxB-like protein
VIVFGLGFIVLLAKNLGWIEPSEFRTVLFTAYAAFFAGTFAYHGALHLGYRRIARAMSRSSAAVYGPYEMTFDASGIVYRTAQAETRVPWDAITEVRDTSSLVLIWINSAHGGFPVPARVFPNHAQRAAFITAIRAHATQAKKT